MDACFVRVVISCTALASAVDAFGFAADAAAVWVEFRDVRFVPAPRHPKPFGVRVVKGLRVHYPRVFVVEHVG